MVQWWEPPTNVALVWFRPGAIGGLSSLLVLASSEGFSLGSWVFLPPQKHSKFQFNQDRRPAWEPAKADVASSLNIVIN